MIIPSITLNGYDSSSILSIKAPGSPSSPLQITYFLSDVALATNCHLVPVGKPAPPLPLRPLSLTISITSLGVLTQRQILRASKPPSFRYSLISTGLITPRCSVAIFICPLRNSATGVSVLSEEYLLIDFGALSNTNPSKKLYTLLFILAKELLALKCRWITSLTSSGFILV